MRRQERLAQRNKLKRDPALAAELAESRLQPITYREAGPTLAPALQVCTLLLAPRPQPTPAPHHQGPALQIFMLLVALRELCQIYSTIGMVLFLHACMCHGLSSTLSVQQDLPCPCCFAKHGP